MGLFPNFLATAIRKDAIAGGIKQGISLEAISWIAYKRVLLRMTWLEKLIKDDIKLLHDTADTPGVPIQTSVRLRHRATQLEYAIGIKTNTPEGVK